MKVEKFFDGYNTIAVYDSDDGFTLIKYKDKRPYEPKASNHSFTQPSLF